MNKNEYISTSALSHTSIRNQSGGPMAQVRRLGPKVGSHLTLFCIHCMNRVNSHNDSES